MNITALREDTPGCIEKCHLNNAGAALMPKPVLEAMVSHLRLESMEGGYEAAAMAAEEANRFYTCFAHLLHTKPRNIACVSSATDAYSRALSAIPFQEGDVILTTNNDYVSNQIAFLSLQKKRGVRVVRVSDLPEGGVDPARMEEAIGRYAPRLVSVTHVPTNTGLVQPVEAIGQLCRAAGVLYLVDACQSVGQLDVDAEKIGCDFLSGTCRKFLRGPRGIGFLYVSDRALDVGLEPLFIDMRGGEWTTPDAYQSRDDARRFEDWEFNYAGVIGSAVAAGYANEIGMRQIEARNNEISGYFREQLMAHIPGGRLLDQGEMLSNIITLDIKGWSPLALRDGLYKRNINTGASPNFVAIIDFGRKGVEGVLRISPHYYNTEAEADQLVAALQEIISS